MQVLLIPRDEAKGLGDSSEGRILLIEPDVNRARRLTQILGTHVRAQLRVAGTSGEALLLMRECLPDLVLTSTFLTPSDEALIRAHLLDTPGAAHVQIVNVPPFIDDDGSTEGAPRKVLTFLGRRPNASSCRPADVIEDITAYLEHARVHRQRPVTEMSASTALVQTAPSVLLAKPASVPSFDPRQPDDRRRARRRPTGELPWLSTVQLPWGTEVKVLDISNSGVLLESTLRLVVGSTLDLQLVGQDGQVRVPAKMVRSEIAGVDGLGVRYRAAAAFARELQIPGMIDARTTASPRALGELLARVMADADSTKPADLRARFERELRELLPVRDVQLRLTPVIESFGTDSIVFAVPQVAGPPTILQVTFHRDYKPSLMEFRLLKAAASLAGVVLQFAPLEGPAAPASAGGGPMMFRSLRPVIQSRW
jgi:hypothetical protein